ncbi:hypothetical protein ACW7G2_06020 [Luteimonas sp. A277]
MHPRFPTLAITALMLLSCSSDHAPATGQRPESIAPIVAATPAPGLAAGSHDTPTRVVSTQFPFPVMPDWVEWQGLESHDLMRQVLSTTWLHDGDPATQAAAYRQRLSASGYRIGPGELSGNTVAAFTGMGSIAGQPYRFAIDFSHASAGEQHVVLVFTPCTA